ncbi:MAG: toxin-antitoxin system HicB family antitoxin [Bacteroidales bacterium]|nr:toxin-antitoxin system HicB family antitoxin [Bacteroidales bacterium]
MITFAKMISFMENTGRVQTVIRLRPDVMERVKYRAKSQNISVNAFVENALIEATKVPIPKLPKDFKIDPLVESLSGIIPAPSKEMLESDDRLAYILSK